MPIQNPGTGTGKMSEAEARSLLAAAYLVYISAPWNVAYPEANCFKYEYDEYTATLSKLGKPVGHIDQNLKNTLYDNAVLVRCYCDEMAGHPIIKDIWNRANSLTPNPYIFTDPDAGMEKMEDHEKS